LTEIEENKRKMVNITINIPHLYDENIHKLIDMKIVPSRSEAIRIALREYLQDEYGENLGLLGFFKKE
jgi:metal-responsive CopG/Arc/MetJ family transcriptional regulator